MDPSERNQVVKTQRIRLLDVFVIGPLMIVGGFALARQRHPVLGLALGGMGLSTVIYNYVNYERVRAAGTT